MLDKPCEDVRNHVRFVSFSLGATLVNGFMIEREDRTYATS
jgi:hypothetical protein